MKAKSTNMDNDIGLHCVLFNILQKNLDIMYTGVTSSASSSTFILLNVFEGSRFQRKSSQICTPKDLKIKDGSSVLFLFAFRLNVLVFWMGK